MGFSIVIPARYGSLRLPAKPLHDIHGRSLIQRVCDCAAKSDAQHIIVATDDERIKAAVTDVEVCLTRQDHRSGTDRLAEVVDQCGFDDDHIIVNLQGDEPLMPAVVIDQVANNLSDRPAIATSTVCVRINEVADVFDPNVVKVVVDQKGYALYFSRAPIAWDRENFPLQNDQPLPIDAAHFRHIGLYAYRAGFLRKFVHWSACPPERTELLEQLRILWYGEKIHVEEALASPGPGVDTEVDLDRVRRIFAASVDP